MIYSFSSIDTYKQCPRKFYYSYIEKLPRKPSIHFERGKIMHNVIERFFESADSNMDLDDMKFLGRNLLIACWNKKKEELETLGVGNLDFYLEESKLMVDRWVEYFFNEMQSEVDAGYIRADAFERLRPQMEVNYKSDELELSGRIDSINEKDGEVEVVDFKTSKDADVGKYRLQIGIYALLYKMEHGKLPDKGALFFFKHGKKRVVVDEELVEDVKKELEEVKEKTKSVVREDYPKCVTSLCKWSTGQCDYFEKCFKNDREYAEEKRKG